MSSPKKLLSITAESYMQNFCKPFYKEIALTNFMHDITFGQGQISMLVSNANVFEFYHKNKIPMLCTNDTGRTLAAGIYLNKILEQQYKDCSVLMPLMLKVGKQFDQNFGQNSLHMVVREDSCQHLYTLFFDLNENDFLHWVVNNGSFIQEFIANYDACAKDLIEEAKAPENRIKLPNSSDNNLSISEIKQNVIPFVHKKNKLAIHLSTQQNRCIKLLMQGKSAKEIAAEMELSPRTIEHYLEKIRNILGCTSNKDLIVSYYEQVQK